MKFLEAYIKGLFIIEPDPFHDERGFFYRVFCKNEFNQINHKKEIVQINHSFTKQKGAIRGLHFQYSPKAEIKMIKCLSGSVFDVALDLRKNSPSFLKWHGEILSAENKKMIYIPEGFAHGFQTLKTNSELIYFHTDFYDPKFEGGIRYDDPKINIKWPLKITNSSKRDSEFKLLDETFKGIDL